jgi:hypothetical protein
MATKTTTNLTLDEVVKRTAPDGTMQAIVDNLMEENMILQDAIARESNGIFSNKTTRWTKEPSGGYRKLNEGGIYEKGVTGVVIDTIGMLDTWSRVDKVEARAAANPTQFLNDEMMSFVRGLGKTVAGDIIYSNTDTTPEQFTGIAPRLASLATTANVLNAGGTGSDLTSIYVMDWAPDKVHLIFPKNSKAGIDREDLGLIQAFDTATPPAPYMAFVNHFTWDIGLAVKNEKSIGRVANIETAGVANIFDEDDLIILMTRMTKGAGRVIYVNETIMAQMQIRMKDKENVNFTSSDGLDGGGPVMRFNGVPVHQVDQILNTEAALT